MELEYRSFDVMTERGASVRNTAVRRSTPPNHLVVFVPGRGYSCVKPLVYYATSAALETGADVLRVVYDHATSAMASDEKFESLLMDDLAASVRRAISERTYARITFVGKSIGTWAIAAFLRDHRETLGEASLSCVMLTPIFGVDVAYRRFTEHAVPSLYFIGTADPHYLEDRVDRVRALPGARVLAIEGADHSLEIDASLDQSLTALRDVSERTRDFFR